MGISAQAERRDQTRRAFRGTVELALPEDAEGYEADGINLSVGGMALQTSFLPDIGTELDCRFALDGGAPIMARGEVVWASEHGQDGGSFGFRFTDLSVDAEKAIRESLTQSEPGDRNAGGASKPGSEPSKARLFIPGMEAPLRARVHTTMDDVLVLGSDLSFLKMGEQVHVEHDGRRVSGGIADVGVEIDPHSSIVRLVLTVALGDKAAAGMTGKYSPVPIVIDACVQAAVPAGSQVAAAVSANSTAKRKAAQATEHLASHQDDDVDDTQAVPAMHAEPEPTTESAEDGMAPIRTPPAWLVGTLRILRTGSLAIARGIGPTLRKLGAGIMLAVAWCVARVRSQFGRNEEASRAQGRRQQQPARAAAMPTPTESAPRRKIGLYVLAGVGLTAVAFAFVTGQRAPRPRRPRPQVAVTAPVIPETGTTAANAAPPVAEPGPATGDLGGGDPTGANAGADAPTQAPATPGRTAARGVNRAGPAVVSAGAGGRHMPTDLVAAARSRSANNAETPSIRLANGTTRPGGATGVLSMNRNTANVMSGRQPGAVSITPRGAQVVGNPTVRSGTQLRLRMDGAIASISGAATGNTLTIRMPGRRAAEMAAPLARLDPRIQGAGVFNRGGAAELVLRFRGPAPLFAARANGTSVVITLAAPAAVGARRPAPATMAHGPHAAQPSRAAQAPARTAQRR